MSIKFVDILKSNIMVTSFRSFVVGGSLDGEFVRGHFTHNKIYTFPFYDVESKQHYNEYYIYERKDVVLQTNSCNSHMFKLFTPEYNLLMNHHRFNHFMDCATLMNDRQQTGKLIFVGCDSINVNGKDVYPLSIDDRPSQVRYQNRLDRIARGII